MVAVETNKELAIGSLVIHSTIPVIYVASKCTVPCVVVICTATLKPPPAIFSMIVMIAAHSCHYIISWAPEIKRSISIIHMTCPVATRKWDIHCSSATEVPTAIFSVVVMVTLYRIESLSRITIDIQVSIPAILPSSYSTEE